MFMSRKPLRKLFRRVFFLLFAAILCFNTFAPLPRTEPTVRHKDTGERFLPDYGHMLVAAHRIGKRFAPDNTIMALKYCLTSETPPDVIESDVQITADGELVLYHDLFLEKRSDAEDVFGRKHIPVFAKTYAQLRQLNMGAKYQENDKLPYAGLHGDDVPDDLRIPKVSQMLDCAEALAPGRLSYILEVKYPLPWGRQIVDKLYTILAERQMADRVILASFWPDVSAYIDLRYAGKLLRSANPIEVLDLYGCFKRDVDLSDEQFPFMAVQMPYYWKGERLLLSNLGQTAFIDYLHRYGLSVQYYTLHNEKEMRDLYIGGADLVMADFPPKAFSVIRNTHIEQEASS